MKKTLLYIGNFRPQFSTENDVKKSFEALGWSVATIQEDTMNEGTVREIIATAHNYDFILYTRTWSRTGELWRQVLRGVKGKTPTVSFHLDLYIGLERGNNLKADTFFLSDFVFSADGGHQKEFADMGINHHWLPPAILKDSVYTGEYRKEYDYDVVFVGAYNYHHEWAYRRYLIDWLKNTYADRFRLFGTNETVRGKDLNDLYATAKVVVGDSTFSHKYWSDRIPETVGRGGFLIHPRVDGLGDEFELYKHLIPYYVGETDTLKEIIDYYVAHDAEREKIKRAGMDHALLHHTYEVRAQQIIDHLKEHGAI